MQILAVVANIQMRTLETEVGNGSMSTVIGHGLAGPKGTRNCKKEPVEASASVSRPFFSKGKVVKIPLLRLGHKWQHNGSSGRLSIPWEKFSFFLYGRRTLEWIQSEIGFDSR